MLGSADFRAGWTDTLNLIPATTAITLVYNDPAISLPQMRAHIEILRIRVDRMLFGRHYHKMPRSAGWAVVEGLGTHPHWHVGWAIPANAIGDLLALLDGGLWRRYAPAGSFILKPITDTGWASYATKELKTSDHVYVFP